MLYPPFHIVQGQPFDTTVTWTRDDEPVDASTWTGTLRIVASPLGTEIGEWAVDLAVAGEVGIEITDTEDFPALAKLGEFVTAFYEIRLDEPGGAGAVLQGAVAVTGRL